MMHARACRLQLRLLQSTPAYAGTSNLTQRRSSNRETGRSPTREGRQSWCPPGYTSETDTLDPLYPVAGVIGREYITYYVVYRHAQDTRDMLQNEMIDAMRLAIQSQQTDGWLMSYCTSDMVSKALTLMVTTKYNWYTTNHHVGQGHATNFITKIAGTMCPFMQTNESSISETAKNTVWEIGHWVSTHLCMNLMAMRTRI